MKKLFLAVALISFVGLSNVEAAPCDGEKCTKECTDKKHKKASTDKKTADKKACASKDGKKSCCASKAKASKTTTNNDKVEKVEDKSAE
ncbi:MAG: hypothetical protein P1U44_11980 [Vicingaceae bacterium]|jgi:hypothetical protein|nr:MAG: hypothetical protein VR77_07140 [Flavobacteriales bacterium BRH_c54]MBL1231885.1 hypothetical protein [Flavobacteriales bacterium]MBQ21597.1 hypothetical protein [Flavobacteriales bacterium]MDF1676425.1 hypothetical protein [Vicingaceae bacterium]|tara:strand:- start:129936 stop:130202 length:267 start_codon:yes stop_codon:yes gene_type:complete